MSFEVKDLSISYRIGNNWRPVVTDVSFSISNGEVLGIVGESGCGKTTLARALLRLLPRNGRVDGGSVSIDGTDMLAMSPRDFRAIQWDRISMVFQGAMNVLDPVYQVGRQITEAIRIHRPKMSRKEVWAQAEALLASVGIERERARAYPHELSGGMKQRVGIAMAMALTPDLVVADEPTTALDVVTQDTVLAALTSMQKANGFSMILVSHDMGVIAETCDRVAVMYAGKIVEMGTVRQIFKQPSHPYTIGLINAIPEVSAKRTAVSIPGHPPSDLGALSGCRFADRCPFRAAKCSQPPPFVELGPGHRDRCHFPELRETFREKGRLATTWEQVGERLMSWMGGGEEI